MSQGMLPDRKAAQRQMRRRRLIEALRELAARLGPDISVARFYKETGICSDTVYRLFDNWAELRTAAGLPPAVDRRRALTRHTPERLLARLRELAAERGEEITCSEFCRRSGIAFATILARFGSWREFKRAAGLSAVRKSGPSPRFTREEVLERLRQLVEQRGDLTLEEFCRELGISPATIRRYGTWTELRRALKLPPRVRQGYARFTADIFATDPACLTDEFIRDHFDHLSTGDLLRMARDCDRTRAPGERD